MSFASEGPGERPRHLQPAGIEPQPPVVTPASSGSGPGSGDAGQVLDTLRASADQELTIAERISAKARQAFALAAGVFVVAQTVAFNSFQVANLGGTERRWMFGLAIVSVAILSVAAFFTIKTDSTFASGDLPLAAMEDDLNAAYDGDDQVIGRLGGYYLGVVRSRRSANTTRRRWYGRTRATVVLALATTMAELVVSLAARIN